MFVTFLKYEEMQNWILKEKPVTNESRKLFEIIKEQYLELTEMLEEPEKHIPNEILYCSDCPFSDSDPYQLEQNNGYCHYLHSGDWEDDHIGLLWDGCKECGVNEDFSKYDEEYGFDDKKE